MPGERNLMKQTRAVAILIKNDEILLMHRGHRKEGTDFWVFPGGSVEKNEGVKAALLRELEEETTIKARLVRKLYSHDYTTSEQHYFLCEYISGTPQLGDSIELERIEKDKNVIYEPQWVKTKELKKLLLYPLEIRDWLIEDLVSGFKKEVRKETLNTSDLRQTL